MKAINTITFDPIDVFKVKKRQTRLLHFMILGQSQAGGFLASPAISLTPDENALTLTNGPLDADTENGLFIPLVEGDTYDNGGSDTDVETMATSLAQQLLAFINSTDVKVCVTVHYHGGSTIQALSDGGANQANGRDAAVAASNRVATLCEELDYVYERHFIISHGGSGLNPYSEAVSALINDLIANTAGTNTVHTLLDQQRITDPDYGLQLYDIRSENIEITIPRRNVVEYNADGVHLTNHGTRHLAMYYAISFFDKLFGIGYEPLILNASDIALIGDVLIIPVLNAEGELVGVGDFNVKIFNESTELTGIFAIQGNNIRFTITNNKPEGTATITVRAAQGTGSLRDSRSNAGIIFRNAANELYSVNKYLIRANYTKEIAFQNRVLLNMTGDANVITSPDANGRYWNNVSSNATNRNASTAGYTTGNFVTTKNQATTISLTVVEPVDDDFGDGTGANQNGGYNTDFGDYVAPTMYGSWFSDANTSGSWRINGLDPSKTYAVSFLGGRNSPGARIIQIATQSDFSDQQEYDGFGVTLSDLITFTISGVTTQTFYIRTKAGSLFGYIGIIDIKEV